MVGVAGDYLVVAGGLFGAASVTRNGGVDAGLVVHGGLDTPETSSCKSSH